MFSFKTNEDVIKYVSENEGMVGVVGELVVATVY
jgi:hypothetical protein